VVPPFFFDVCLFIYMRRLSRPRRVVLRGAVHILVILYTNDISIFPLSGLNDAQVRGGGFSLTPPTALRFGVDVAM
jgi:hypothetical protein